MTWGLADSSLGLYGYAANSPVRHIDPDGRSNTNKTGEYIVSRLEDALYIPLRNEKGEYQYDERGRFRFITIHTIVVAPDETIEWAFDGSRDIKGNYTKISGTALLGRKVDYTVYPEGMGFDDIESCKNNKNADFIKRVRNKVCKRNDLISGYYQYGTDGAKFLSHKWDETMRKDLGMGADEEFTSELLQKSMIQPNSFPFGFTYRKLMSM